MITNVPVETIIAKVKVGDWIKIIYVDDRKMNGKVCQVIPKSESDINELEVCLDPRDCIGDYSLVKSVNGFRVASLETTANKVLIEWIPIHNSKSFMSNVVQFFKNITASAEDKLLLKHGIEDPIGTPTSTGLELSAQVSYKANRAKVIEIVTQLEAEEQKAKE